MTELLDTPTGDSPPAAYFPSVGDAIVVGIVDVGEYQQRDYESGDPISWPDGRPKMGKVITGLVVSTSGDTCGGGQRTQVPLSPGDLVTFWAEGGKFLTYQAALKAAGGINVGDVMQWKRTDDKAPSNPRHNPAKTYEAKIRRPTAKDGDLAGRCRDARENLKRHTLDEPAGGDGGGYDDESPF